MRARVIASRAWREKRVRRVGESACSGHPPFHAEHESEDADAGGERGTSPVGLEEKRVMHVGGSACSGPRGTRARGCGCGSTHAAARTCSAQQRFRVEHGEQARHGAAVGEMIRKALTDTHRQRRMERGGRVGERRVGRGRHAGLGASLSSPTCTGTGTSRGGYSRCGAPFELQANGSFPREACGRGVRSACAAHVVVVRGDASRGGPLHGERFEQSSVRVVTAAACHVPGKVAGACGAGGGVAVTAQRHRMGAERG